MHNDLLQRLSGLYAFTPDGQLGVYDDRGTLVPDASMTDALDGQHLALFKAYLRLTRRDPMRIGLIYPTRADRPWKTDTLFFTEEVVRRLFPAGDLHSPLTGFQKRHQENSFYRGMELLVAAADKPSNPFPCCPVLIYRNLVLGDFLEELARPEEPQDADTPVVEVLNLLALLPAMHKETGVPPKINAITRERLLHTGARRENSFTLVEQIDSRPATQPVGDAYFDVDERAARQITLQADDLAALHHTQRYDRVERWLEKPHRAIIPGDLRRFMQFTDLNDRCLDVLAARSLVYTAPAHTVLLDAGMVDKWNMFLLEGVLLLEAKDGQCLTLEGGSPAASAPVAFLKPRKYKVSTMTAASFLWIHDALLHAVDEVRRSTQKPVPQVAVGGSSVLHTPLRRR